jgi:hypothetical protein
VEDAVAIHAEGGTQSTGHEHAGQAKSATYYYHNIRNRLLYGALHLTTDDLRRWRLLTPVIALEVLLQGGRRQFAHPVVPLSAAVRGIRDGLRLSGGWRAVPSPAAPASSPRDAPSADSLVVAVLTYRRPDDIGAILPLVVEQAAAVAQGAAERGDGPRSLHVVVIDNDPGGDARQTVLAAAAVSPVPVEYVHEPRPGISAARNRALAVAQDHDLLVFIDDDERPDPGWLAALLTEWRRSGAVGVAGPVRSEYEVEPDAWVRAGGFFTRRRPTTGTRLEVAATNNLLLDLRAVRAAGLAFDDALGTQGGEDSLFTRQLVASGGLLTWSAAARVVDVVPRARITHRWVVLRAFSSGNTWSLTSLALAPTDPAARLRHRSVAIRRGTVRAAGGIGRIALGAVTGSLEHRAKGTRTLARGAGMIAGALGWSYQEYARRS